MPEDRKVAPEIGGKFRIGQILEREIAEGSVTFREQCLVIAVRAVGADNSVASVTSTVRSAKTLQLLTEAQVDWSETPSGLNWHPVKSLTSEESIQALAESVFQQATELEQLQARVEEVEGRHTKLVKHASDLHDMILALQGRVDSLNESPHPAKEPAQDPRPVADPARTQGKGGK